MPLESLQSYLEALADYHNRRAIALGFQLRDARSNRRKRLLEHKLDYHENQLEGLKERLLEEKKRRTRTTYRRRGRVLTRRVREDEE